MELFNEQSDQTKSTLDALIGPGGKFHRENRDEALELLAKSKAEADSYIKSTLEPKLDELIEDNKRLRDEVNAGRTMQEMLDQIKLQQSFRQEEPPLTQDAPKNTPAFDPKQLEALVANKINEHESVKKQAENFQLVLGKLKEHYGSEYESVLRNQVDVLGLTKDLVETLAKTHPKALLRTLGIEGPRQTQSFQAPPRSSQTFAPKGAEKRTWSYYQKLRREQPDLYYSPKLTAQRHADHQTLGPEFEDGDWQN